MTEPGPSVPVRGRILVADDEPHIRRILVTLLESAGYEVEQVETGTQAMDRLTGPGDYQAALLDIMMPGYTGLEILQRTRQLPNRQSLPIVILTAKGQDADRQEALGFGADAFVTKPFSPKKLIAQIHELLSRP